MPCSGTGSSLVGISTRVNGRHAFVHECLLMLIARETVLRDGVEFGKEDISKRMKRSSLSVSKALTTLRKNGFIVVEPQYDENGGQLMNRYRATSAGIERAEQLKSLA